MMPRRPLSLTYRRLEAQARERPPKQRMEMFSCSLAVPRTLTKNDASTMKWTFSTLPKRNLEFSATSRQQPTSWGAERLLQCLHQILPIFRRHHQRRDDQTPRPLMALARPPNL